MRLIKRTGVPHAPAPVEAPDSEPGPIPTEIRVSRTLVKSRPELAELVASEPRLRDERIEVTLDEKGFGTRVAIVATEDSGLTATDLELVLDELGAPQKRPFGSA